MLLGTGKLFYIYCKGWPLPHIALSLFTFDYILTLRVLDSFKFYFMLCYQAWPNVPCTKLSHCLLIVIDS